MIGFPKGAGGKLPAYARETGVDAVGIDETVDPVWAARGLPDSMPVQGNLDPLLLIAGGDELERQALRVLEAFAGASACVQSRPRYRPDNPDRQCRAAAGCRAATGRRDFPPAIGLNARHAGAALHDLFLAQGRSHHLRDLLDGRAVHAPAVFRLSPGMPNRIRPKTRKWIEREAKLLKIILTPSIGVVWVLGLILAWHIGAFSQGWFHAQVAAGARPCRATRAS